jgi:catechol 2,3-dioxygenase-like lactoylglutathione lyase family enzyme
MNMNHIGICVVDLERSIEFYRMHLDMQLAYRAPFSGQPYEEVMALSDVRGHMCVLRNNTVQLELFQFEHPSPSGSPAAETMANRGISHFGIEVDDIDATHRRLVAAGVRCHSPVREFKGGMRAAYVRDPDGNVFELLQRRESLHG